MPDAALWLAVPAAVVMVVGLAALAFRGSVRSTTMADLRTSNEELRERDVDRDRIIHEMQAKIDALADANRVLANTVTAADSVNALTVLVHSLIAQLDAHHKEAMRAWAKILDRLPK